MKKIILLILTLFFSIVGYSQFPTPGVEGFEGTTGADLPSPATPSPWTLGTGATGNQWAIFDNGVGLTRRWNINTVATNVYQGVNAAFMDRENIGINNTSEDYLATPLVTVPPNGQLRFWTRSTISGPNGTEYLIKVNTTTGTQTTIANYTNTPAQWTEATLNTVFNVYEEKVVDLSAFDGQQVYIAFVMRFTQPTAGLSGDRWLIDRVSLVERCLEPTNLSATDITQTTANLNWTNPSGSNSWEIEVIPAVGGTQTGVGVVYNGALPYVASGLSPNTCYVYYVRSLCTDGSSAWVGPFNFCTVPPGLTCTAPIDITTLPYSTNDNTANYGDSTDTAQPTACAGTATNYMTGNDVFYSYTPATSGTISITMTPNDNWSGIFVYQGCANVGVTCVAGVANNGGGIRSIPSLSVTAGLPYIIVISTNATPQTVGYSLVIQEVNCPQPTNLNASNIGQTSATLTWDNPGGATSWEVVVQTPNVGIPTGTGNTTNTNTSYSALGLTQATAYEYYVRADCGNGTFSAWSGPFLFNTNICDVSQQCNYTFRLTDSFGDGWNGNTMSVRQNGIEVALLGPTFTDGGGPINITVPMCDGLPFELFWNAGGAFADEVGVSIINSFNQTIYTKAAGTGAQNSSLYIGTVNCLTPACLPPTNLVATNISQTGATLGWTTTGPETSWEIIVLPAGSPAPLPNNPLWTAAPNNPYILGGLTSGTAYNFYVRPICSQTNTGDSSLAGTFNTTICPPTNQCLYTFTMTDTFGDGWNGNTMSVIQNGIVVGTFGATFTNGNGPVSVQIPLCHGIAFQLQWNAGGAFAGEVGVSIQEALAPQATIYTKAPGTGAQGTTLYNGTGECFLPTCPKPISLTATSVTQTSAVLSWTEQGTATSWEIFIVPAGSAAPTPTSLGIVTTNPYTLTNLPPGTAYTFYVRAICSTTDSSLWSQPLTFGTLPVNDECSNATFAIVNQNLNCVQTTPGTLIGATQSLPAVNCPPGIANDDVWYTFTATAATHIISFNNVVPLNTDLDYAIFSGNSCGALTQLNCNAADGLTAGQTYYIRIYSSSAQQQLVNFNLCIGTLPCTEAPAFCTGQTVTYANSTNVPSLGQIGCLFTSPNPAFFFLQVNQAGPLTYLISQVDNNGVGRDVDYVAWGPFNDLQTACTGVPQNPLPGILPAPTLAAGCPGTLHACSYSTAPTEIMCVPNAQLCEVYVIMITNFSNQAGTVTFTQTNSGGGTTACFPINTFNYPQTTYCQDGVDPTPVLAPGASAGTYTSTPGLVIDSVTGTVDLSASTPGAYIVTSSTATTIGGTCNTIPFITTTRTIIITAPASATISYSNASYCNNITALQTVTRTGTVGGTYSATPSGLSIDPITGNFVPSASVPNTYIITYSVPASGGCAAFSTTTQVVIIPATVPTFTQVAPICPGDVLADLPTTSNNGVTGTWSPAMNNTATTTYTFTPTAGLCATTATMTIGVGSTTPTFTQVPPICPGASLTDLPTTSNNGVEGTWAPAMNNTATTTYTFTPNAGICVGAVSMTIVVNTPTIVPTFTSVDPICIGDTLSALPTTSNNGITGTWSPALDNTATTTYTFTPNTGQCALATTLTIIVNPNLVVTVNNPTVCAGSIATVTATPAIPGNYSYTWTVPSTFPNPGNVASFNTTVPGTYTVVINQVTNFCNTDFESPTATGAFPNLFDESLVPCWDTTSADGIIEIWPPGFEGVNAYSGNQLIELNGNTPGTLYQDFSVLPGTALTISFAHRGRQGNDVVGVEIGPLGGPYVSLGNFTDNNTAWVLHTVNYVVPNSGGNNYTLRFVSVSSAGGSPSIGNLLDSISISSLSCPSQPTSGVVTITTPDTPTFTAIPNICLNGTAPTLPTTSNNGFAGTWSPATVNTSVVGTTNYTFTPNAGICANSATLSITIDAPITPTFTQIANICLNATAPILPTTSNNGFAGTWSPSTVDTSAVGTTTYTFTPNTGICATTATLSVTIDAPITPTFNMIANICLNGTAPTLPTTSNNGLAGTWSPATVNTSVVGTTNYTFTPNAGICATTATLSVTIDAPITPTFNQIANICLNGTAPSLPSTSNNGLAGTWSPATINTSVVGTTTYTFTPNTGICATTATLSVTIDAPITPTFNLIANICLNGTAPTLPTTSNNGLAGTWSPATVNTSVVGTTTYTFTPNTGICATTATVSVTIDAPITPTFNLIANICLNGTAPTLPTTSNNGLAGTWSPATVNTSMVGTTTYTFTPNAGICATIATLSVTIDAPITPTFTQIASICLNGTAPSLPSTSNNGGIAGTWSPAIINTSVVGNTTYTFTPNTGLCATTATMVITINPQTVPTFNQVGPFCQGSIAPSLNNTSINGIAGTWSPSTINTSTAGSSTYTFTPNVGLCATTTTMTIVINTTPIVNPISNVTACDNYILPAPSVGNYFTGPNGTGTQLNTGAIINANTTLYVYAANGSCTDQESFTITISPSPSFTLTGGCVGTNYVLEVMSNNFDTSLATYSWTGPTGVVGGNSPTLQVPANAAGSYTCFVTIPNGTGTCSDSEVFIANDVTCSIPRGISPNGDNLNDTFDLTGLNVKVLSIYNRYGTKVYSKTNYVNEWGGQSDAGHELPDGTYYYVIERNGVEAKSGWVYINREIK
jgi:gliding motility-associated-like protein